MWICSAFRALRFKAHLDRPVRLRVASVILALAAPWLLLGCGGSASTSSQPPRELALERAQLEQVANALRTAEPAVQREVAASRGAWPSIATGLPKTVPTTLRASIGAANAGANALVEPPFVANARTLTGPAAGIGGIYESYERLARQGWGLTNAAVTTIAGATPTGTRTTRTQASFARESSPLYLDAIYDSHYDLSLLGKSLVEGYERLGGPAAFGAALTQSEVDALAGVYSIPGVRLEPHPADAALAG